MNLNLMLFIQKNNSSKIKDGVYIINLDEFKPIGPHQITLYVNSINIIYFESFKVEHISKENKKFIGNKNVITNIYKIQACDSMICVYFCIEFVIEEQR